MIIAVYTDTYDSEYIQIGNTIEEVMEKLEDIDFNTNSLRVFAGVEVKVTKKVIKSVSYTVERI